MILYGYVGVVSNRKSTTIIILGCEFITPPKPIIVNCEFFQSIIMSRHCLFGQLRKSRTSLDIIRVKPLFKETVINTVHMYEQLALVEIF